MFPGIEHLQYILNILEDLSYIIQTENGILPLTFNEIYSYCKITNTKLNKIELGLIRNLSTIYVSTFYESKSEDYPQPYTEIN